MAGSNCVILEYTGKECDVSPYRDDYDSIQNVPIVHAATAWQSKETGQTYILILNESIWMGDTMSHTLINPNQLRHFGTKVQDNPMSDQPLSIITEDNGFCMDLAMAGTICYVDTFAPSEKELHTCPHIVLSSSHPWDPHNVKFPKCRRTLDEEVGGLRYISTVISAPNEKCFDEDNSIFDLNNINRKIASMNVTQSLPAPRKLERTKLDPGTSDVPLINTFESSARHTDVSPQEVSERWGISIATATNTLKNTTQKFLRSAVLPLSRRYRTDRVFTRKTLSGDWSTDTMDGRVKSLAGNICPSLRK